MRTLKLTHEEIALIEEALNTAFYARVKLKETIFKSSILELNELDETLEPITKYSSKIHDLLSEIQEGNKDV